MTPADALVWAETAIRAAAGILRVVSEAQEENRDLTDEEIRSALGDMDAADARWLEALRKRKGDAQ